MNARMMARRARFEEVDIYPVISSEFTNGRDVLEVLKAIGGGGAKIVQLREKNISKREVMALAREYRRVCDDFGMLLIINDHVDVALASGADGVHLGQDDLPLADAVRIAPDLLLGCSTHNLSEALEAQSLGAGYINIGPIYPTNTKNVACGAIGLEALERIAGQVDIPFSVMGGIKERHIPELLRRGARHIAMVTEITQADDIRNRVATLRQCWRQA